MTTTQQVAEPKRTQFGTSLSPRAHALIREIAKQRKWDFNVVIEEALETTVAADPDLAHLRKPTDHRTA